MKTKTIEIYEFDELSESAQDKAIDNIRTINNDYEWWDSIYEDAKDAGIILESFAPSRCLDSQTMCRRLRSSNCR